MIKNMKVEIILQDLEKGTYYGIPVLPPTIQYTNGDTTVHSVNIIDLGNVEIPNGRDLDAFGWQAEFPARHDPGYVVIGQSNLRSPLSYKTIFEDLKERKVPVQVVCPVLGVNKRMFIQTFASEFKGFEGDIGYTINFRELRAIRPKKLTVGGTAPPKGKKQAEDRPAAPKAAAAKTYKVVSGDSLTLIAKKLGIKDWYNQLYLPNKATIGGDPNKIKAGQVLKL